MDFHALQVIPTFQSVKTEAVDECLKTNEPIFAEVTLADSVKARMECDTACLSFSNARKIVP